MNEIYIVFQLLL